MGIKGMKNKLVYAIVAVAFVGGIFATAYAGPILNTITFAGLTIFTEHAQFDKDVIIDGTLTPTDYADGSIQFADLSPEIQTLITFSVCPIVYEGQVTSIDDSSNLLSGIINVGDSIVGFYCYDINTPDLGSGLPEQAVYSLSFYSITIGDDIFGCTFTQAVSIVNDFNGRDQYIVICNGMNTASSSIVSSSSSVSLGDTDGTVFNDKLLPISAPDLSEFEEKVFRWTLGIPGSGINMGEVRGSITSLIHGQ